MHLILKTVSLCASIFAFSCLGQAARSQAVLVKGAEEGQGYLFADSGICYLLTAAHVTDGARRAQVVTQGGSDGTATMIAPFWDGFDLDVGQVRRISDEDCTASFDDLLRGAATPLSGARLVLPIIGPGGVDNYDIAVDRSDYLEFTGRFVDPAEAGKKGMSGGFAVSGATPVGMARATGPDGSIRFIQMAEIAMNLRRWLDRSAFSAPAVPAVPEVVQEGQPYRVAASSAPAVDGAHVIEQMVEGTGPFAYAPGQDAVIVLDNMRDGEKVLSRVSVQSTPTEGYSQPRQIRIDITPSEGGTARFWRADPFPPDGNYDTGPVARRFAASVTLTLIGARGNDPVRIDRIVLD